MRNILKTLSERDWTDFLGQGAIFRQGGNVWLFWGNVEALEKRPDYPAICAPEFFLKDSLSWLAFENSVCIEQERLQKIIGSQIKARHQYCWEVPEIHNFEKQFAWIQENIEEDKISKAVPCVFEKGHRVSEDRSMLLHSIHHSLQFDSGHLYGVWLGDKGVLGLTPETLIEQRDERTFATMALAGTYSLEKYKKNPLSFMEDEKEKNEHLWVVYDLVDTLKKYGDVQAEDMEVATTPTLAHLKTSIVLKARDEISIERLVMDLHPTPALGVYPRQKSRETLDFLNDGQWRGRFGAPFGFSLSPHRALFVVAIRNFQWINNNIYIGSGCGVVKQSDMSKEWRELFSKRQSVKQIFDL